MRRADAGPGAEEGEAALLLARDDLDGESAPLAYGVEEFGAVGGDAQSCGAARRDLRGAVPPRVLHESGDPRDRPVDGLLVEPARLLEALTESRGLGPVDDPSPRAVGTALADV